MSDPDALFDEDDLLEQREMRFHDQRDIGDLWSLTLQGLTLMLPPTSIAGSQLSILQQLFAIKRLDIRASPGSPGLKDLDFLPESLLSLSLRGHYELDDMEELSTLTGLTKLVLHDNTEVDEWPHCLTALSTLREIQITASRAGGPGACLQTDGIAVQAPPHRESWLHLPICFFTCQPCLTRLVLQNHHLGLRDVEAFEGLQALVDLDLEGLIFDSYRYSAYESKLIGKISCAHLQHKALMASPCKVYHHCNGLLRLLTCWPLCAPVQNIKSNGPAAVASKGPISPSELFSALQIFDALAIDQNLPFDFINALQVGTTSSLLTA